MRELESKSSHEGYLYRRKGCSNDGSVLHIASALVSELNLVIGPQECITKTGEITAFRKLLGILTYPAPTLKADIELFFQNEAAPSETTVEKDGLTWRVSAQFTGSLKASNMVIKVASGIITLAVSL